MFPLPGGEVLTLIERALHHHEPLLREMIGGCRAELQRGLLGPLHGLPVPILGATDKTCTLHNHLGCLSCVPSTQTSTQTPTQQFYARHCRLSLLRTNPRACSEPMSVLHIQDVSALSERALGNLIVKCGNRRNWKEDKIQKPRESAEVEGRPEGREAAQ